MFFNAIDAGPANPRRVIGFAMFDSTEASVRDTELRGACSVGGERAYQYMKWSWKIDIPTSVTDKMFKAIALTAFIWAVTTLAAPPRLGLQFDKRAPGDLPRLILPYATYRAARYNANGDVCRFPFPAPGTCY